VGCFPDELVQTILLHFGVDDSHPITTSLCFAVVTMTLRSDTENAGFRLSPSSVIEISFTHE